MSDAKKLSGRRCQCAGCGQYFNSEGSFDKHRTGPWSDRRRLTNYEMQDAGMALNNAGFWVSSRREWRAA